ncbi:hypothetical protein Taro_020418 [Colocasia esculenta]|uniref:Uncharacterized protein n=1 Tax=Colocasia esculenta TaxID=4460 RepID=A0A843V554_COLES|nr:hypothetical protein [Colocasia esculenta]
MLGSIGVKVVTGTSIPRIRPLEPKNNFDLNTKVLARYGSRTMTWTGRKFDVWRTLFLSASRQGGPLDPRSHEPIKTPALDETTPQKKTRSNVGSRDPSLGWTSPRIPRRPPSRGALIYRRGALISSPPLVWFFRISGALLLRHAPLRTAAISTLFTSPLKQVFRTLGFYD